MNTLYYKVTMTISNGGNPFEVYSHYKTIAEAENSIKEFTEHDYNVLKSQIDVVIE